MNYYDDYVAQQMAEAATIPAAVVGIDDGVMTLPDGRRYMKLANGGLQMVENIKPQSLLADQTVRKLIAEALEISGSVQRFRDHALSEIKTFVEVLAGEYGVKRGGDKGNITLMTIDQSMKVERSIGEFIDFGPELEIARELVDACLLDWTEGSRAEVVSIVHRAFRSRKGKVNTKALLELQNIKSQDTRWNDAMQAINDAIIVVATKAYPRFYKKDAAGKWLPINIDVASAQVTATAGGAL